MLLNFGHSIIWNFAESRIWNIPGPEVIQLFSCATQLSLNFILLTSVQIPTIVGILTFVSRKDTASESFRARKIIIFHHFSFYEQLKVHAQLS